MRHLRNSWIVVILCLLAIIGLSSDNLTTASTAYAADQQRQQDSAEKLVPLDLQGRMDSYSLFSHTREQTAHTLLSILPNEPLEHAEADTSRCGYAIRMLGIMRATEATRPLLDMIDAPIINIGGFATQAPVDPVIIQALVKIGNPASHMAVEYLAKDKSEKRAAMYVRVIAQVEGVDVGKFMVQQAADKEKDPAKKARLEAAIPLFANADQPIP